MKISNIHSINFSKKAILTCQVKDWERKEKRNATLYELNPATNLEDREEIRLNERTSYLYPWVLKDLNSTFYMLKDDKTDEVISYAQTSHHLKHKSTRHKGLSTSIDELEGNEHYINALEPMIAGIVKKAQERFDLSVYFNMRSEDVYSLGNLKLPNENGDIFIREKRFETIINNAIQRSNIKFLT